MTLSLNSTEETTQAALALIIDGKLNVVRCSLTGVAIGRIDEATILDTLRSYMIDNAVYTAEQLHDEWELTHYLTNFRPSPIMQRVIQAGGRERYLERMASVKDGDYRLFTYFLQHILFDHERAGARDIKARNLFVSALADYFDDEKVRESVADDMSEVLFMLTVLDSIASLPLFLRIMRNDKQGQALRARLIESDIADLLTNTKVFVTWAQKHIALAGVLTIRGNAYARPVANALASRGVEAKALRDAKKDAFAKGLGDKIAELYGSGKVVKNALTHKEAANRILAKKADDRRATGKTRTKHGVNALSAEDKKAFVQSASDILKAMLAGKMNTIVSDKGE